MASQGKRKRRVRQASGKDMAAFRTIPFWYVFAAFMVLVGLMAPADSPGKYIAFMYAALTAGGAYTCSRNKRIMREAKSLNELAVLMQIEPEDLRRIALERDIEPRLLFDGEPLYHPADFDAALLLLRPASSPDSALLRPAGSATEDANLLRASDNSTAPEPNRVSRS